MTKDKPLVSILSPCYNVAAFLPQCIDSIISQTYSNLQIVLIDDGSKDNTWSIMQSYSAKDSRIEIYHQENQGVAATRNHLLKKVKGDWILFIDADDWIEPDMVEALLLLATDYKADIAECQNVINDVACKKEHSTITKWQREEAIRHFLRHTDFSGSLWIKLIKVNLLQNEKFHPNISYGEDALFCWHLLQKVSVVIRTSAQYHHHKITEGSLSHVSWTPEKKGSASITWDIITKETSVRWPQYYEIARTRYAIEDMWGLYYASLANYPYDEHIRKRQLNIRQNLRLIRKLGLVSINKVIAAYALAYCYPLGKLLRYF